MNSSEVINRIIASHPQIKYLYLVKFGIQKDVKRDCISWTGNEEELYNQALSLRKDIGLPFWQSLMLSIINSGCVSQICLDSCLRHNGVVYKKISATDFINNCFENESRIGISSKVILQDDTIMHIPFIDFHIPISSKGTEIVEYICNIINPHVEGYIINSGNSYHYIANLLMSEHEMIKFLSMANLFAPITDSTWISHQLYENSCTLRLGEKKGRLPIVIKEIS